MSPRLRPAIALAVSLLLLGTMTGPAASAQPTPTTSTSSDRIATPVLSARRVPSLVSSNLADKNIREAIQPLVDQVPENSCLVVSHAGRTIVAEHGDEPFTPASTEKLVTATAALHELGPDTRLRTIAAADAHSSGGVIEGDLYLIGGGDPLLTTDGYRLVLEDPNQPINDFTQLASEIQRTGVTEIRGDIVGDDSRYDSQRWVPSWPTRYQRQDTVGPLSALMVNDGNTGFTSDPDHTTSTRQPGDPPALAAATLKTLLERNGVKVTGSGRAGPAPADRVAVAHLDSMTIHDLVGEMLRESDNTTAELLTKEIGLHHSGQGTTAAGIQAIDDIVAELGLPRDQVTLVDGSGLDQQNRVSCGLLVDLLDVMGPNAFDQQLPVAGESGTLRLRFRHSAAEGRIRAKTGTLNGVDALAGLVATTDGGEITFAFIVNPPDLRGSATLDEFASALVDVPTGPPLDSLGPRPAG